MTALVSQYIEDFGGHLEQGEFTVVGESLSLTVPHSSCTIRLGPKSLRQLLNLRRPVVEGLTYFDHCGFHFADYAEFLINLEGLAEWPAQEPLRFKIGGTLVTVGKCSHLIPALLEPYYRIKDLGQAEFGQFPSVRMNNVTLAEARREVHQAIYYLNADYLDAIRSGAQVWHLATEDDLKYVPRDDRAHLLPRKRVRLRRPLKATPALLLFNDACVAVGDAQFLGFYRVLEYFFAAGIEKEIARLRADANVSTNDLIKIARERAEVDQLRALLSTSLTAAKKAKMTRFATFHKLSSKPGFEALVAALYDFRCSIVHAKAHELHRTSLPDPLEPDAKLSKWAYVARQAALGVIRTFG